MDAILLLWGPVGYAQKTGTDPGPVVVWNLDRPFGRGSVPVFVQSRARFKSAANLGADILINEDPGEQKAGKDLAFDLLDWRTSVDYRTGAAVSSQ